MAHTEARFPTVIATTTLVIRDKIPPPVYDEVGVACANFQVTQQSSRLGWLEPEFGHEPPESIDHQDAAWVAIDEPKNGW